MSTTQVLHQAAQYLAAAGKSFLPEQSDDSHTNLLWRADIESFVTDTLNSQGDVLALSLESYSLDFLNPQAGVVASYALEGARHLDIVNWIERERQLLGIDKTFSPTMHYELPYPPMADEFLFPKLTVVELLEHSKLRTQADEALKFSTEFFHHFSFIRVWPHHFDTGGLGYVNNTENLLSIIDTIGVGLAIPDGMVNDYYYYVSGWNGAVSPDLSSITALSSGEWKNGDWKGAVLEASGKTNLEVNAFFKEAIRAFHLLYA